MTLQQGVRWACFGLAQRTWRLGRAGPTRRCCLQALAADTQPPNDAGLPSSGVQSGQHPHTPSTHVAQHPPTPSTHLAPLAWLALHCSATRLSLVCGPRRDTGRRWSTWKKKGLPGPARRETSRPHGSTRNGGQPSLGRPASGCGGHDWAFCQRQADGGEHRDMHAQRVPLCRLSARPMQPGGHALSRRRMCSGAGGPEHASRRRTRAM